MHWNHYVSGIFLTLLIILFFDTYNLLSSVYFVTVYSWVLSRNKQKLDGESLKKVEDALSKYSDLAEHRRSFVFKDFSDAECQFSEKFLTDFFTSNFW